MAGAGIIGVLSWLVPWSRRDAWVAEWEAELAWAAAARPPAGRLALRLRALAALRDALWIRRRHGRQAVFAQDLRQALRGLRKRPGHALSIVLTLGLGVGGATAVFSVVDALLLRPLPYEEPERLAQVWRQTAPGHAVPSVEREVLDAWAAEGALFEKVEAFGQANAVVTGHGEPRVENALLATAGLFELLGVPPLRGRLFTAAEVAAGARVVLVSESWWRSALGADAGVIGSSVVLNDVAYEIIGVLPRRFRFPYAGREFYLPLPEDGGSTDLTGLARLRAGVSIEVANERLTYLAAAFAAQQPREGWHAVTLLPVVTRDIAARQGSALRLLALAVLAMLLIGCTNAANMLLVEGAARARELTIRGALGATRGRLVRLMLTESAVLCTLAALVGIGVAALGVSVLGRIAPSTFAVFGSGEFRVDARVLGFAVALAVATGLLCGVGPALVASGRRAQLTGSERSGTGTLGMRRTRAALVVTELALAMALLVSASLLIRSFAHRMGTDVGVPRQGLLELDVSLPSYRYPDLDARRAFHDRLAERLRGLPGVRGVTLAEVIPPGGGFSFGLRLEAEGLPVRDEGQPELMMINGVDDGFFDVLEIPLVAGRVFDARDTQASERVAIIDTDLARFLWPDSPPEAVVHRRFRFDGDGEWHTVAGVVEDVVIMGVDPQLDPMCARGACAYEAFRPLRQARRNWALSVGIRTTGGTDGLAEAIRSAVWALDPSIPVNSLATVEQRLFEQLDAPRFVMRLVTTFTLIAMGLAALGVYAVLAYAVALRTREFGVRIALGARRSDVLRDVVSGAALFAGAGVLLGTLAALAAARIMTSLLHGVTSTDPLSIATAAVILSAVALLAAVLPARRAMAVSPLDALRVE